MTESDEGTVFAVGAPWPWSPNLVAQRGFGWHPEADNLLLLVEKDVTPAMCDDLAGPADLALLAHGPLVGLLVRFGGGWGWMETMAWRSPGQPVPENVVDPEPGHLLFKVVLVDADTKQIAHMRAFTVSPHFTKMLRREVTDRWATGIEVDEAMHHMDEWRAKAPTMKAALKAALARSHGGD